MNLFYTRTVVGLAALLVMAAAVCATIQPVKADNDDKDEKTFDHYADKETNTRNK